LQNILGHLRKVSEGQMGSQYTYKSNPFFVEVYCVYEPAYIWSYIQFNMTITYIVPSFFQIYPNLSHKQITNNSNSSPHKVLHLAIFVVKSLCK